MCLKYTQYKIKFSIVLVSISLFIDYSFNRLPNFLKFFLIADMIKYSYS